MLRATAQVPRQWQWYMTMVLVLCQKYVKAPPSDPPLSDVYLMCDRTKAKTFFGKRNSYGFHCEDPAQYPPFRSQLTRGWFQSSSILLQVSSLPPRRGSHLSGREPNDVCSHVIDADVPVPAHMSSSRLRRWRPGSQWEAPTLPVSQVWPQLMHHQHSRHLKRRQRKFTSPMWHHYVIT